MNTAAWAAAIPVVILCTILALARRHEARKKRREKERQADGKAAGDHSHA